MIESKRYLLINKDEDHTNNIININISEIQKLSQRHRSVNKGEK